MNNAERYHFKDFTHSHYCELLDIATKNFSFVNYSDIQSRINERCALWRHDVDFCMQSALEMAKLEARKGVQSTYFLLLHSEFYNLMDAEDSKCAKQIISLGHNIGLHFDSHFYKITKDVQLEEHLLLEKNLLEKIYGCQISAFSFHKNNEFTMSCQKETYAGMVNTYASVFQRDFGYLSDSNGYWKFQRLHDFLTTSKHQIVQVLTHPEWWTEEVMSPLQKVERILRERTDRTRIWYINTLAEYNRENVDH